MTLHLEIPDSVTQAMRLPPSKQRQRLLIELAVTLYTQGILSFGKARELAGMEKLAFGQLLGKRGVSRHHGEEEIQDDFSYARGE